MNHPTGLRIATEVDQHDRQDPSRVYQAWLVRLILALLVVLGLQVFLTLLQGRSPGRSPENPPAFGENRADLQRKQ